MPPTVVDAVVATLPLEPTGRRPAALPNANAGCVVATALSDANANAGAAARRTKTKAVASRYLTRSSKPTSTSISSAAKSPAPRAPASTDRSRPVLPNVAAATDAAVASGGSATTTTRTFAVAFQSPAYSLETSRASSASASSAAATPEPKRPTARAKVSDASQNTYRWPLASAQCGRDGRALAKTPACSASTKKEAIAAIFGAVRSTAFRGTPRRASVHGANEYLLALSSDTDSASSGGSGSGDGGAPRRSVGSGPRPSPRSAMSSSARFSPDAMGTRSERFAYPVMPSPSRVPATSSPASAPVKKRSLFTGLLSSPFSRASPKQPSPSKPVASAFRRAVSASPARRSTEGPASAGNTQVKSCGVDGDMKCRLPEAIKTKEEHQLRLLYTRELQWRFVNAQAGAATSSQTMGAEKNLCGAWVSILRMRKSVAIRKMQLQLLRNSCKLMAILRGHMKYLEEWSFLERDHAHSLSGTTQALTATVLRLPVSNGAMADIKGIRNALGSAVDVMHTIGNSTSTQLPKLARTNVLVSQLSSVFIQEHILVAQCRELLSTLASMHVRYSSLQGQRIQLNQTRPWHFQ
ncbi:QWRF motif-containing protein 2-like [Miscanthus floridulus]|uniref:QWRF motif-containing protein 2-like n=1 Tax=Miscanthus floridulus TaxID=154761 RepID=UPI00345A7C15